MTAGAVTLSDISSSDWSLMLDRTAAGGPGSGIGQIVQGLADIGQCVAIIVGTQPGEDPFRPTFGCDLTQYIDRPLGAALPGLVSTVTGAIEQWEPRVTVLSVTGAVDAGSLSTLTVAVQWEIDLGSAAPTSSAIGSAAQTTVVSIG
jgi:Bacteriophage baseplate protein W